MSTDGAVAQVARLQAQDVGDLVQRLERGMSSVGPHDAALMNQHLLDALDQGDYRRFLVWPPQNPVAALYVAPNASAIPAGDPVAAAALAEPLERSAWRVLIGDAPLTASLAKSAPVPLFRRGPRVREQRFMVLRHPQKMPIRGLRRAGLRDVEAVTDFACRLHEEDLMGPAISRTARAAVRVRMMEAMTRSGIWIVERQGVPVAKIDLSVCSDRRGAQIAGVYVLPEWRNQGIAASAVSEIAAQLLARGLPGVTLHVRSDNAAARRAYETAGFEDIAPLVLALR